MTGLDHIAVVVDDLDKAVSLYRDGLGLDFQGIEELTERGVKVAFMAVGGTRIELIQSIREDSEVATWVRGHGEGLHHVAFQVDDLDKALDQAEAAGATRVKGSTRKGAGGARVAFLHPKTTSGVLLEMVEGPDKEGSGTASGS